MTQFSTNLEGGMARLAFHWLRLCFSPPPGSFLRTPLGLSMGISFLWESHGKRPMGWDSTHLYFP